MRLPTYQVTTTGSNKTMQWTCSVTPWTVRLTWRQRLRYLWAAIRGRETIR